MQDKQQFDQLMLQYNQLKNGSEEIHHLIQKEDFDTAMTMLKSREALFLNCKCMRKYLELTPEQELELNTILEEIKTSEMTNIKLLEEGMANVQKELKLSQKNEKIQHAYDFDENQKGSIVNYME